MCRRVLSGTIPPSIGKLERLKDLDLDYTRISGTIPPELGECSQFYELDLDSSFISGVQGTHIERSTCRAKTCTSKLLC